MNPVPLSKPVLLSGLCPVSLGGEHCPTVIYGQRLPVVEAEDFQRLDETSRPTKALMSAQAPNRDQPGHQWGE